MVFELVAGVILVTAVLFDVFESVVLPRRAGNLFRLAPHVLALPWPIWRRIGLRLEPAWRREDFLGTFAPLAIVLVLGAVLGIGSARQRKSGRPVNGALFAAVGLLSVTAAGIAVIA